MRYNHKYEINPDYKTEAFENDLLLYSENKAKGIYLNEYAYMVWLLCREGMTIRQTIQHLEQIYPGQRDSIEADVIFVYDAFIADEIIIASNSD